MAIQIVDFPIEHGGSFHSYLYVYQRVNHVSFHQFSGFLLPSNDTMPRERPAPDVHEESGHHVAGDAQFPAFRLCSAGSQAWLGGQPVATPLSMEVCWWKS